MKIKLWKEYVWGKQSLAQLANKYSRSIPFIRKQFDSIVVKKTEHKPRKLHVVADTVFFGREYGIAVFRSPRLKKNLCLAEVERETPLVYALGIKYLQSLGYELSSVTIDGKRGVAGVFGDIPVQMCQFHQMQIITRYLTRRPKLEAGKELKIIVKTLVQSNEKEFAEKINDWHEKWEDFLQEKTKNSETGRWCFTHRRIRSAWRSLKTNLPYLFIYMKYPELDICNTTNSLDGSFSHLKTLLRIHRGQNANMRKKMIDEILRNQPD